MCLFSTPDRTILHCLQVSGDVCGLNTSKKYKSVYFMCIRSLEMRVYIMENIQYFLNSSSNTDVKLQLQLRFSTLIFFIELNLLKHKA